MDFKISPTVIRVQWNKLRSKMHKAISTKVQGKTSFETTQQCQSNFLIFYFYVIFGFLTHKKKKIEQKKNDKKYAQIDKQTTININNKQTIKHRHKA